MALIGGDAVSPAKGGKGREEVAFIGGDAVRPREDVALIRGDAVR